MKRDDEERKFYEKYIKPQYTIIKRIKRKIFWIPKRIKNIDDIVIIDYDFFIKLLCVLMIYVLVRAIFLGIIDIYRWFFPVKENIFTPIPFFQELMFNA